MRRIDRMMAAVLILTALFQAPNAGADPRVVHLGDRTTRLEPLFEILSSGPEELTLCFELRALYVEDVEDEGRIVQRVSLPGEALPTTAGGPLVPSITRLVSIPHGSRADLRVVEVETVRLDGDARAKAGADAEMPSKGTGPLAVLGRPAVLRDLAVVPLTLEPVRYDPEHKSIEVARRVTLSVEFSGEDTPSVKGPRREVIAASFDRIYRALVLNYEGPKDGQRIGNGSYLVICPDDSTVAALLQPLIEWRTRMGYPSILATTADIGGSSAASIKTYIQVAYNSWEAPPEYILLVGDARYSDILIPAFYYYGTGEGEGDYRYTLLEGDDLLPEAHIGRLSVDSCENLESVVDKICRYEMAPYLDDPGWFSRACLIADTREPPHGSGVTCKHVMQWIHHRLEQLGYSGVDSIYDDPFPEQFTESLNRGVSIMAYRGHEPMSGISTSVITDLENGEMLPFAVPITCHTGSFAARPMAQSEALLRAGSLGSPKGAVGCIGIATDETFTRTNNVMMYGIFQGLLYEEIAEIGADLTRGKLELYLHFYDGNPALTEATLLWNNLMGDPATRCWTQCPESLSVTAPESVPVGTTSISVTVHDARTRSPMPGAGVCLWKAEETHVSGLTDGGGQVELCVETPTPGPVELTVTLRNRLPFLGEIAVRSDESAIVLEGVEVDDDAVPPSSGNGDGRIEPGEVVGLRVGLTNRGTETAEDLEAVLRAEDPFIVVTDSAETFGDLPGDSTAWRGGAFGFRIDPGCPDGHLIRLGFDIARNGGSDRGLVELPVLSSAFTYVGHTWNDAGSDLDPGETGQVSIEVRNTGSVDAAGATGRMISLVPQLSVVDSAGAFGPAAVGETAESLPDPFEVSASPGGYPGQAAPCLLVLETSEGCRDTVLVLLTIGTASSTDPVGPDGYGYFAYDNTDTAYAQAPVYEWIEIAGNYGGPGEDVGLEDVSRDWLGGGDHVVVELPFPFTYYGSTFETITVSSDGWLAMGSTELEECWNTTIPGAGGPDAMIAPFWEDLYQTTGARVWKYDDPANHRFVVEWSRLRNKAPTPQVEVFEVILPDPAYHPTPTGDGEILFQYHTVSNDEGEQAHATVGIENLDHSDGLLYTYYDVYPGGAAPLAPGLAIRFTPAPPSAAADGDILPSRTRLHPNYPNPFNPGTTIRYDLAQCGPVDLRVHDVSGRVIRTLVRAPHQEPAEYCLTWDGRDDRGRPVAPGVYFCRLHTTARDETTKMVLLR